MPSGSRAYVAVLKIELHFPEAGSLKARRRELAPVKAYVQRLGGAVAEAGPHDRWQLATVVASFVAGTPARLDEVCDRLEAWLDARFPSGVNVHKSVHSLRDLVE
ncbi:MAG: DUF503 domain-containing protein [Actinomycetota bacterium]|nr:DUF503 domain-containing protein [Actinomycetota bacterium]